MSNLERIIQRFNAGTIEIWLSTQLIGKQEYNDLMNYLEAELEGLGIAC